MRIAGMLVLTKELFAANLVVLVVMVISGYFYFPFLLPLRASTGVLEFSYNLLQYTVPLLTAYLIAYFGVFRRAADTQHPAGSSFSTVLGVICMFTIFLLIFGTGLVLLGREIPEYENKTGKAKNRRVVYSEIRGPDDYGDRMLHRMRQTGRVYHMILVPVIVIVTAIVVLYTVLIIQGLNRFPPHFNPLLSSDFFLYFLIALGFPAFVMTGLSTHYLNRSYPYLVGQEGKVVGSPRGSIFDRRVRVWVNGRVLRARIAAGAAKGQQVQVIQVVHDRWSMDCQIYCHLKEPDDESVLP